MENLTDVPAQACVEIEQWIERGRFDRAQDVLQVALKADPGHQRLRYFQALLHVCREEPKRAAGVLDELLSEVPEDFDARLLQARVSRELGLLSDSERRYLELLEEYPQDAYLLAQYALLMLQAGFSKKSAQLHAEAARLAPDDPFVLAAGALIILAIRPGRPDDPNLAALIRAEPEAARTLQLIATSLVSRGEWRAARRVTQALVDTTPGDPWSVRLAASVRYEGHWSMLPLYPMLRWGWAGSIAIYILAVSSIYLLEGRLSRDAMTVVLTIWFAYVVYSWVWPVLLRKWKFPEL